MALPNLASISSSVCGWVSGKGVREKLVARGWRVSDAPAEGDLSCLPRCAAGGRGETLPSSRLVLALGPAILPADMWSLPSILMSAKISG